MSSNYQPQYEAFVQDSYQNVVFDSSEDAIAYGVERSNRAPLLSTFDQNTLAAIAVWDSRLPPSVYFAAERSRLQPSFQHESPGDGLARVVSANEERNGEIATTPLSFSQRNLQHQYDIGTLPSESLLGASSDEKRDSGVGDFDDFLDYAGPEIMAGGASNDSSFVYDGDCDRQPTPLQYHLIQSRESRAQQDVAPSNPTSQNVPSLTVSLSSTSDAPSITCPLCTDKRFTGVWAHRNLTRHMERVHAPSSSPGGVRHFPCSHGECERTFRREDARLVHERRSHPELNRPPPTRRRRSGELRL